MLFRSNRIFETVLYNFFISEEFAVSKIYSAGVQEKNQFIVGGHLDVRRILEKFVETFDYLYGEQDEAFLEEAGRQTLFSFISQTHYKWDRKLQHRAGDQKQ